MQQEQMIVAIKRTLNRDAESWKKSFILMKTEQLYYNARYYVRSSVGEKKNIVIDTINANPLWRTGNAI